MNKRIFAGNFPAGVVYADKETQEHGDYKKLAFLSYGTLELEIKKSCPVEFEKEIREDAKTIQDRKGKFYEISSCGQGVTLGYAIKEIKVPLSFSSDFVLWFIGTVYNTVEHPIYGGHQLTKEQLKHSSGEYKDKLYKIILEVYKSDTAIMKNKINEINKDGKK